MVDPRPPQKEEHLLLQRSELTRTPRCFRGDPCRTTPLKLRSSVFRTFNTGMILGTYASGRPLSAKGNHLVGEDPRDPFVHVKNRAVGDSSRHLRLRFWVVVVNTRQGEGSSTTKFPYKGLASAVRRVRSAKLSSGGPLLQVNYDGH